MGQHPALGLLDSRTLRQYITADKIVCGMVLCQGSAKIMEQRAGEIMWENKQTTKKERIRQGENRTRRERIKWWRIKKENKSNQLSCLSPAAVMLFMGGTYCWSSRTCHSSSKSVSQYHQYNVWLHMAEQISNGSNLVTSTWNDL